MLVRSFAALLLIGCQTKVVDGDTDVLSDTDTVANPDTDVVGPALTARPANPTCVAPARPPSLTDATTVRVFPNLKFDAAVQVIQPPDDPTVFWVVRQNGLIVRFDNDPNVSTTTTVLDIVNLVNDSSNELGLLSIAFHPDWTNNHEIIASFNTGTAGAPRSRVSRFRSADGGATIDPTTEEVLLNFAQPYTNHNGGSSAFGPDGMLYLGFGDGGLAGDPLESGQDRHSLLGKILRIDLDHGAPYAIPSDNPFADGVDGAPEVWAYGIRNPWRFSFDSVDGTLWLGDVGQDAVEEIDRVSRGGNYGWNTMEGDRCYDPITRCDRAGLILPVETMLHGDGHYSVTGGVVYRGTAIPSLVGKYVWGDYGSGQIWSLESDPITGAETKSELVSGVASVTHIGADAEGEILFLTRNQGIRKLVPNGASVPEAFPATLRETGCFDAGNQPLPMLIPYAPNHPFWSDGAEKARWLSVPDGKTISVDATGHLVLPKGSVLVKQFEVDGQRVETRLMVRHEDGDWAGYSYAWNDARTQATLLPGSGLVDGWSIPSRSGCLRCHNATAGGTLGLTLDQLDVERTQSNGYVENQIDELVRLGLLRGAPTHPGALPPVDGDAPLEARARAWLAVNCAMCHVPQGTANGDLDLRVTTSLADSGLCGPADQGDLGLGAGAPVIRAGDAAGSVLMKRIGELGAYHMPPLATAEVDEVGVAVVAAWINSLGTCP